LAQGDRRTGESQSPNNIYTSKYISVTIIEN